MRGRIIIESVCVSSVEQRVVLRFGVARVEIRNKNCITSSLVMKEANGCEVRACCFLATVLTQ